MRRAVACHPADPSASRVPSSRWSPNRTLADGWAYAGAYASERERRAALSTWIHEDHHHRPHTACGNKTPITRLTNPSGQYSEV